MADSKESEELEDVLSRVKASRSAAEAEASGFDWRKLVNYLIVGGLAALLAVNVYNLWGGSEPMGLAGKEAPTFALETVGSSEMVALQDYRGKVVLLDFWATWCLPCERQMPVLQNIHEDQALEDVKVLSINTDERSPDRRQKVSTYLSDAGYTFETLLDTGRTRSNYGVRSIPALVVVGPEGLITYADSGIHSEDHLRGLIEKAR